MNKIRLFVNAFIFTSLLLFSPAIFAQQKTPAKSVPSLKTPTPNIEVNKLMILEPSQGRPRIIRAEESFRFMFVKKSFVPQIKTMLVNSLCPQERIRLSVVSPPMVIQDNYWVMLLKAPALTRPGVYDLLIDLGVGYQRVPRAIKIVKNIKTKFRFIHLSNMNIGQPDAPDFDNRLIDEINLLNPEFIIATGDFLANGRAQGAEGWRRVKKFLAKFNAPSYILCGEQDDFMTYPQEINQSLTGTIDYGNYHFFLLMDTAIRPIEKDKLQINALVNDLKTAKRSIMTFLVANSDRLGVIDGLESIGLNPADVFAIGKVKAIICGGSTDWDFSEYMGKLKRAKLAGKIDYIRTGQSSTCMENGGDGISRYRVIDVDNSEIRYIYPEENPIAGKKLQYSIPVGRIRIFNKGPNDGSLPTEQITIVNTLNQSFANCQVIFKLAGNNPNSVIVQNARKTDVFRANSNMLIVIANVDLPEKSAVHILATTNRQTAQAYQKLPIKFNLIAPPVLTFRQAKSLTGLKYLKGNGNLQLSITNLSNKRITTAVQVTLAGQSLILGKPIISKTPLSSKPTNAINGINTAGEDIDILPSGTVRMRVFPSLRHITSGKHWISVYCLNDPLKRVTVFPITVKLEQ